MAVAYPLGLPLFIWMLTGAPTELGAIPLIKTSDHGWSIPLAWATLAVLIFHRKIARKLHTTVIWPAVNLLLRAILALVLAGAFAVDLAAKKQRFAGAIYCLVSLALYGGLFTVVALAGDTLTETPALLLLFFGLFPLTNAFWDFLSLGLTRWCLRQSLPKTPLKMRFLRIPMVRPMVFSLLDLMGACLTLVGLILSLLLGVSLMNSLAYEPILPLAQLMQDLQPGSDGPDMTWAYLMVFSTFLPSALHFLLFLPSLALRFPGPWKHWLPSDQTLEPETAAALAALWVTLPLAAISLGAWYLWPALPLWHDNTLTWILAQISTLIEALELV
ncbi:hypothetical protein [Phaeobacter inhibens]|uniref:hypothetical protein n=2 Tax=Phaeobacter inhibens TaxID=221822 RepID=UPI000F4A9321|nr:hypothetical protein [Phaeobacter inhibens]